MSPLIERDDQLARLEARLAEAQAGRGGIVLVGGDAGVGKTRLVRSALERAGIRALRSEATQETQAAYAPVASLLRTHLLDTHDPAAAELELVLAGRPGPASHPSALVGEISRWVTGLGDAAPVAVFLDDLQWADSATVELLPRLAGDLELVPVLLVAAYRSDEVMRGHPVRKLRVALRRSGVLDEVEVPPLGPEGTAELSAQLLGADVAPTLAAVVHDRTQGVPFFVEELAAALAAKELLTVAPAGIELRAGQEVPLPDTVRDAVLVRLEALDAGARAALEVAAVAGLRFELDVLAELGVSGEIDEAVAVGLVEEPTSGTGAFRHALAREAVYTGIPWARRRDLHRLVADALERRGSGPRLIAEHRLAAGEREPARVALVAAADVSCSVHAYRDAAGAIRAALELWPDDDRDGRLGAVDRLARCAERAGELREAVRLWEELLTELEPGSLGAARAKASLALALRLLGNVQRAAALRLEAAGALEEAGLWAEAFEHRLWLVWIDDPGPLDGLLAALAAADEAAERADRIDLKARASSLRGQMLARRGRFDEGYEIARAALALAHESGDAKAIYDAYWYLAAIGVTRGDYAGAEAALEEATAFCRASGLRSDEVFCVACLAKVHARQGEWDPRARARGERARLSGRDAASRAGPPSGPPVTSSLPAAAPADARRWLDELESTSRRLQLPPRPRGGARLARARRRGRRRARRGPRPLPRAPGARAEGSSRTLTTPHRRCNGPRSRTSASEARPRSSPPAPTCSPR